MRKILHPFSQHTCTAEFMIRFGLSYGFPSAFRRFDHFFFMARMPSMMASELPMVLVPMAVTLSSWTGTLNRRAIMETHRFWMSIRVSMRRFRTGVPRTCGDGILLIVNEVLAKALNHELLSFFFHVSGDEACKVESGSAI
jgi:hypothetical protein